MNEVSDRALVMSTRRGDVDAFGELVRRYQNSVFNVCYRLLGERREAEDLAQEVFLRAYHRLDRYDAGRPFGPWIRRVATNLCLNHLRRARPATYPLDQEAHQPIHGGPANPESIQAEAARVEAVRNAILSLPPHYRAVIELRHYQDLSYAEIAAELGISLQLVKTHLYRARRALEARLQTTDE